MNTQEQQTPPTPQAPRPLRMRLMGWKRPAAWLTGGLVLVGGLGFGGVPLLRSVIETQLGEALHRPVSIGSLSFNPYTLNLTVRELRVLEPQGQTEALGFDQLDVNLEAESLLRGGVVLEHLSLQGPRVHFVRQQDGRYNWSDLIDEILNKPDDGSQSHFALHNISIEGGRLRFEDQPTGRTEHITGLSLGLPFISNLPSWVDTTVEPRLALSLNGKPLGVQAQATPFAQTRSAQVHLSLEALPLADYLVYLPIKPRFELRDGRVSLDLDLAFAQAPGATPSIRLQGGVDVAGLDVRHLGGAPALAWENLHLELADVEPLKARMALARLEIRKPELHVARDKHGRLSLLDLLPPPAGATSAAPAPSAPAQALDLSLAQLDLSGGHIHWQDAQPTGGFATQIQDLDVSLKDVSLAGKTPARVALSLRNEHGAQVEHTGHFTLAPLAAEGELKLSGVRLPDYRAYYGPAAPQADLASGVLGGEVHYRYTGEGPEAGIQLDKTRLGLENLLLRLRGEPQPLLKLASLGVEGLQLDTHQRQVQIAALKGQGSQILLRRLADGSLQWQKLMPPGAPAQPDPKPAARTPAQAAGPAWQVALDKLQLDRWAIRVEDATLNPPMVLNVAPLALQVEGLTTRPGSQARVRLQAGVNQRGRLGVSGSLAVAPFKAGLDLDLKQVDLTMLQPYVTEQLKVAITRGMVTSRSRLELAEQGGQMKGRFRGNLTLGDFASVDKLNAADFLKWKSLYFGGLDIQLAPLAIGVDEIALSDFYTRLILSQDGSLNLREIQVQKDAPPAPPPASGAAAAPAPVLPLRIGRITLQGGNIAYSDRFVRPNYDANLTGMGGRLTGLSSDPGTIAELDLRGRVDGSAPVEVTGRLNPFREDKALDILASVKDFELSGVSPYSGKYVGYGIDKGKLSARLNYKIEDRTLSATNQVFIDQLTFGEAVDSPDALKLPVRLAVSLLKNSKGEIDLNLPVTGTLDDPQFSIGGLVWKVVVNLVEKAITSPFALLGSMLGGQAEELAWLDFQPGFSTLDPVAEDKLKAIARAMADKPQLKLDIAARIDPAQDPDGLKRALMLARVHALKVQDMARKGETAGADGVQISPAEYPALLAQVYKDARFPKPRNLIGFTKDLPVAEMEKLLLTNTVVDDEALKRLAQGRAQAAKAWLLEQGKIAPERIFLLAPHEGDDGKQPKARVSRVDFSLR